MFAVQQIVGLVLFFQALGACPAGQFKCDNSICIKDALKCNNIDNCGDMSDEMHCPLPKPPRFDDGGEHKDITQVNFTKLRIAYYAGEHIANYTVIVTIKKGDSVVATQEVSQKSPFADTMVIEGDMKNGTTYNVMLQSKSIAGIVGNATQKNYTVPQMNLPVVPGLFYMYSDDYATLKIALKNYPKSSIEYTTTIKTTDRNGNETINDVILTNSEIKTEIDNLKNDTTYDITVTSETFVGKSLPLKLNYTIPRMVAPGAPANLSATVKSNFEDIELQVNYGRPHDDGGSAKLAGVIIMCYVANDTKKLQSCTKTSTGIDEGADKGHTEFLHLPGETEFYFKIQLSSEADQDGPPADMHYTTPATQAVPTNKPASPVNEGLSKYAIIGISVGGGILVLAIIIVGTRYRWKHRRSANGESTTDYVRQKNDA